MDGRRFRRWWLCGGLLAAIGCHRDATQPNNFGLPKPGQTMAALPPPGAKKSFWGGNSTPTPPIANGMPVETVVTTTKKSGKGLQPETEATLAETHVAAALADPPPTNKDQLLDMARQRYQRALKADPKNKSALLGLARMHSGLGEKDKAMEVYRKYMELNPKDHASMYEAAVAQARWQDWNGAAAWCENALKIDPENRTYRKTLGFCQARAGKWDEGFATLCKVVPEAQARYNVARVLEDLNYTDHSRQWLMMALQINPEFAPAREFLAELDQGRTQPPAQEQNPVMRAGYAQPQQP